ncbi:hypothetical protein BKI52_11860 [marine bacterium AO1-C]|nr:hypothetical protein BKI52_11860 [marine bacterium AO1-C]
MKIFSFLLILTLSGLVVHSGYTQGCSDAGFCTMGAMKPDQQYSKRIPLKLRTLGVSYYQGKSTLTPVIRSVTFDLDFKLGNKGALQVKVPYMWVQGSLGRTAGVSDISLSYTRNVYRNYNFDINITVGAKIPTNNSNLEDGDRGRDLPMYYQTSLGSYDVVFGASLISKNWLFAVGYQQALNRNQNRFAWGEWGDYPFPSYIRDYDMGMNLQRGTDVMLRVERNFRFSRFNFNVGVLPIYRITKDEVMNPMTGQRVKLDNTTGLALSALAGVGYAFNVSSSIKLMYGYKFTDREVNPDGLTRDNVLTVSYLLNF